MKRAILGGVMAAMMMSGTASGEVVASFGYTDLTGDYNSATNLFRVAGRSISTGDFTRVGDGTALFNDGVLSGNGTPSFFLEMSVMNIDNVALTADGSGSIRIIDANGDEFRGTFSGNWQGTGLGFTFASSTGVDFEFDSTNGDGTFDGSSSGSFTNFADGELFTGAVSLLFLQETPTNFFQSSFRVTNTQADGIIIPAPAASLALVGMGLMASRRRRG